MIMYDDFTPGLVARRQRAVELTNEYNDSFGQPIAEREAILRRLFKRVGTWVHFELTFRCEFGDQISVGDRFFANYDCVMLDGGGITIGDGVLFGPRVAIHTSNHATGPAESTAVGGQDRPVTIGDRVWIGGGVTVNPGASIGSDTVIGSGSVVTEAIPAGVLAAGAPCQVIREITDGDRTGFIPPVGRGPA